METIRIERTSSPRPRPKEAELSFGKYFSDHRFVLDYLEGKGWHDPRVEPYGPFSFDPAAAVLHYGQELFEGSKAFRAADGGIRLFRPQAHAARMAAGAPRLSMAAPSEAEFLEGLRALVRVDADWVPRGEGTALYLRPTLVATEAFLGVRPAQRYVFFIIASPVGSYYGGQALRCVRIWVEKQDVRAARGGLGAVKAGGNYAASLNAAVRAKKRGFDQVLWLDGRDREWLEEVGTMNVFVVLGDTLVTPPLSDSILAGVTRDSVLRLARDWGLDVKERPVSVSELREAHRAGALKEVFGTGTAAVVSPVGVLGLDDGELQIGDGQPGPVALRLYDEICGIQRGTRPDPHGWSVPLE